MAEDLYGKKPFQLLKVGDEGASDPFIARLWIGVCELRDQMLLCSGLRGAVYERRRLEFDRAHGAVLTPLKAARTAAKEAVTLLERHVDQVASGSIVRFQRNAFEITASVDAPLHDAVSRLLVQGVIALKKVPELTLQFGLDVGAVFQKPSTFLTAMSALAAQGHESLAAYLTTSRHTWSEGFVAQRAAVEHKGWTLPPFKYEQSGEGTVTATEPEVAGARVSEFTKLSLRRLVAFAENVTVYAVKTALRGIRVVEIPTTRRAPDFPRRFECLPASAPKWTADSVSGLWRPQSEWALIFSDDDFRW
jgi:hypothetical protein